VPKTGSSFGNVLLRWACGENLTNVVKPGGGFVIDARCRDAFRLRKEARNTWPIGDHVPIQADASVDYLHHVLAFVRSPSSRAHSHKAFYQNKQEKATSLCTFLTKHNLFGYQTGWILGNQGRGKLRLTPKQRTWACHRLHYFAFVGITDFWHASICLFHREFGGLDRPDDYKNVRNGRYNHAEVKNMLELGCPDEADEQLFQCALDIFFSKLSKTVCVNLLHEKDLGSELANAKLKNILGETS